MKQPDSPDALTRRALLQGGLDAGALLATGLPAFAAAPPGFDQWRDNFRSRALAKGISDATYTRVMGRIEPDMSVFRQMQKQPEFHEQIWQYFNRRASDWRIIAGKEALRKHEALFARIEQDFGVERGTLLALWGVESAYGDPLVQQNHMRPVFPSLAALAWNEPRRRAYWETELINALRIVDRGWGTPEEMRGSWAGAGVTRADGQPFSQPNASAQMWVPVAGGPAFLLGPNFYAVKSYNPSMNYALAICHLGDRILGGPPFINPFPGSERALTLAEVQEMQTRLTKAGFDTGGTDGRVGNDTMKAVRDYQTKMGLLPADGYGGLKVLARLRQGG